MILVLVFCVVYGLMLCYCYLSVHLGSILEGPNPENLKPVVEQAMPMLIELLKDSSIVVRDTSAWTVGRICEILPDAVINENFLNPLLHAMVEGLNSEPRVAANVCWVRNKDAVSETVYALYAISPVLEIHGF